MAERGKPTGHEPGRHDIAQGAKHQEVDCTHCSTLHRGEARGYPPRMIDKSTILVTGASGNLGSACLRSLAKRGIQGTPAGRGARGPEWRILDFSDPSTFGTALQGIERVFLVRPPAIADVSGVVKPFVDAMRDSGIRQVVFVSLIGVEDRPQVPHHAIEQLLRNSGIPAVMLRPTFFMQNLAGEHCAEIRDRSEIRVPAGKARINFIDTADIGAVAATVLTSPVEPGVQHLDLSGPESWSFAGIARALSDELGRPIRYRHPGPVRFALYKVLRGTPLGYAVVMALLYTASRNGSADVKTDTVERILGRAPRSLPEFIRENRELWIPA